MTEKEIRLWMATEEAEDLWQVSVDGRLFEKKYSLSEVMRIALPSADSEVEILHVSQWDVKDPAWVQLDPRSRLSDKKRAQLRKHSKRGKRYLRSTWKQIAILLVMVGVAALLLRREDPADNVDISPQARPDPMEVIFAQIEAQRQMRGVRPQLTESGIPKLDGQVVVARSDRILFVANLSDQDWESCEVILNDDDGYRYVFQGPVKPKQTLYEPLRSFTRHGQPFVVEEMELVDVRIRVPGFAEWRDAF